MSKPLVIDLFCGLGGWTKGFLAEGYDAIGFDLEAHHYGDRRYPGQLVLQDVLTLHGSQFCNAAVIVASPPCQNYSYMFQPWGRAKELAKWYRADPARIAELNALFDACFRIHREANEGVRNHCQICGVHLLSHHAWTGRGACGRFFGGTRYIPLVVENVVGAQCWVGPAPAHFGSYYLWGDVANVGGRLLRSDVAPRFGNSLRAGRRQKTAGHVNQRDGALFTSHLTNQAEHGVKQGGSGAEWWDKTLDARRRDATEQMRYSGETWRESAAAGVKCSGQKHGQEYAMTRGPVEGLKVGGHWFGSYAEQKAAGTISPMRLHSSGSNTRKAASALIAEIPFELANYIARAFKPA